jgi:hypothetical protein
MSYLNPPYTDNFKELCAAMPTFYLDVVEMRAVLRAQGHLLDGVCEGAEKLVDANFILTADESTIRLWEKALDITYSENLTLDQRRRVVIGYIIGLGHIGESEIRTIIGQYTEMPVAFSFMRGVITVLIDGEIFDEDTLLDTLRRRIPAHLGLNMSIHIRKQYYQDVSVSMIGVVESRFRLEPVTPEHISVTDQIQFWQGGRSCAEINGLPPTPMETSHTAYSVAQGGLSRLHIVTDTPSVERTAAGIKTTSGGLYCHTHIKSKLIE